MSIRTQTSSLRLAMFSVVISLCAPVALLIIIPPGGYLSLDGEHAARVCTVDLVRRIGRRTVWLGPSASVLADSVAGMFWTNAALVPAIVVWQVGVAVDASQRRSRLQETRQT